MQSLAEFLSTSPSILISHFYLNYLIILLSISNDRIFAFFNLSLSLSRSIMCPLRETREVTSLRIASTVPFFMYSDAA